MAFADPQSVTIDSTPVTLNRREFGARQGVFASTDGTVSLKIAHTGPAGRERRLLSLSAKKIATDPLTSVNTESTLTTHVVLQEQRGWTVEEQIEQLAALASLLTESTVATKFVGGEA